MEHLPVALAAVVALAAATASTPPLAVNESTPSIPSTDRSELFHLLNRLGISDSCVACALEARDLLQETRGLLHAVNKTWIQPRHCKDVLDAGDGQSGVRVIHPYPGEPERPLRVYCDQTTDLGGWTVVQRRMVSPVREDFYRTFQEYREGFGNLEEEFWLGLDALHALTSTEPQRLRIDLADWEGGHRYAKYGTFRVDAPTEKYRLTVGGYSGTAGDSLAEHSGQRFSTHDSDSDFNLGYNCAERRRGAWWYKDCHYSNLNGYQYEDNPSANAKGINWFHWRGYEYSLRRTTMMLRPAPRSGK